MARQMERLVPQDRQTFAADVPEHPQTEAHKQDSRPVEDERSEARPDEAPSDDVSDDQATKHARQRNKAAAQKAQGTDVDALLQGLMQGAPAVPAVPAASNVSNVSNVSVAPVAPVAVLVPIATTPASLDAPTSVTTPATALQTVVLSPQVHLITDPNQAPSPESLAAFAKSMGLDESTIQSLLAQTPAHAPSALTAGLSSPNNALQAAISTAFNGANSDSVANANNTVATQLAAVVASTQTPVAASGAGLAAAATTLVAPALPGLTATDMATIQQLQITVLPAAVLPLNTPAMTAAANAPMPSTLDMLSLLGTGVDEQDVSALLSRFSEDAGSDSHPDQQQESSNEANNFSSFAQALSRSNNAAQAAASAAPTTANMGEVYDQLSDKMATEMAARMHKQLSDGEWKMKFALRPSNLGGVEIQLEMKDGKLDAVFRADNPLTRDLLQNSSQRLREALGNFGINAGQVNVGHGGANNPQNNSGHAGKQPQVRDNSTSQVNGSGSAISPASAPQNDHTSLLDLYA
jgi:flagellar hook-length control protein FliK